MWIAPERRRANRWIAPVLAVAAGAAVGTTLTLRGETETGLVTAAVLIAYAVLLGARGGEGSGSHETFGGTSSRGGPHTRAAAATGDVLVAAIVAALIVQTLRGAEGTQIWVLAGLAAVACVTYLIAVLSISWY
jgi:hypothetical protein